jgi:hypothetical protein
MQPDKHSANDTFFFFLDKTFVFALNVFYPAVVQQSGNMRLKKGQGGICLGFPF